MSNVIIRKAFEDRLATWAAAQLPPLPIAYENRAFSPPANGRYLQAFLIPARTDSEFLEGNHRGYDGIFQVSIVMPLGSGTAQAGNIALALDAIYPVYFKDNAISIYITSPMSAAPPIITDNTFVLPVSCLYRGEL